MRHRGIGLARVLGVLLHLLAAHSLDAAIRYVDDSAPAGGNGTSWSHAYRSLKTALNAAEPGDVIRVGRGTYRPTGANGSRTATFKITNGIVVQGGYAGYGAANPNKLKPSKYKTILSGDLNHDDGPDFADNDENSFHVVTFKTATAATQLRGVTITGGNANADDFDSPHCRGGAIRCVGDSNPTIDHCIIRRNRANLYGGGISAPDGAPTIRSCKLHDNFAGSSTTGSGGAMWLSSGTVDDCDFINNHANIASASGGAIVGASITITNSTFASNGSSAVMCGDHSMVRDCTFTDNAGEDGGAITITGIDAAVIRCDFDSNGASSFGGAVFVQPNGAATVTNCKFFGNAASAGNALANRGALTAINCLLSGNDYDFGSHSAIYNLNGDLTIINCTISHNKSDGLGGGVFNNSGTVAVLNTILWGNGADGTEAAQLFSQGGSLSVEFSCVQGWTGAMGGQSTFGSNPKFMNPNGADNQFGTSDDDLRLAGDSPCRDAGDSGGLPQDEFDLDDDGDTAELLPVDLDSQNRFIGAAVDLGALES